MIEPCLKKSAQRKATYNAAAAAATANKSLLGFTTSAQSVPGLAAGRLTVKLTGRAPWPDWSHGAHDLSQRPRRGSATLSLASCVVKSASPLALAMDWASSRERRL